MAILAGIDEAGYGPLLGPLVVTGVAFEVPDEALDRCLWDRLAASVTPRVRRRDPRLPIVDSKKLYHGAHGLGMLERTALVMAAAGGIRAQHFRQLLDGIAPRLADDLPGYPWYERFNLRLPTANDPIGIAMQASAVKKDLQRCRLRFIGVFTEVLPAGQFNRLVQNTRNKAVVSMGLALGITQRIAALARDQELRVCIDRQGGRTRYRPSLMTAFDHRHLQILEESPTRSAYRLERGSNRFRIEFITGGEKHQLPIALASILSKYLRELFMIALNRYWTDRVDRLKPTAGYYQDAQRFLTDIEPLIQRQGISRAQLVRIR